MNKKISYWKIEIASKKTKLIIKKVMLIILNLNIYKKIIIKFTRIKRL